MSHLSSTMKRIEADEQAALESDPAAAALPIVLPGVGNTVQFRLRGGEWRNRRNTFGAIVIATHPEAGTIDIVVVLDADDWMTQTNVPQLVEGGDWGWSLVESTASAEVAALRAEFERFKQDLGEVVFGGNMRGDLSLYDMIAELRDRLAAPKVKPKAAPKASKKRS